MKAKKYKVVATDRSNYGKVIKATTNYMGTLTDVKTGEQYAESELQQIPENHAAYFGVHIGRFGMFLFGREYMKYHSYQFGCGVDFINSEDKYMDFEMRVACFGVGVRFMWVSKLL